MAKTYTFDIGTRLRTTLNADLTGYDTVEYRIKDPDGKTVTETCVIEDETNGIVYYDSVAEDFEDSGTYYLQVEVVFAAGSQFLSETTSFRVYSAYE